MALVKGMSDLKPTETNAGKVLHALLRSDKNTLNNKELCLGTNPARTWRKLRDHGIIKVTKSKQGRQSFDLSIAEGFLPLRTIYQSAIGSPPLLNLMATIQIYNSFAENQLIITKALRYSDLERKELTKYAISYFLALQKLPEKVRNRIGALLGHEVLMYFGEKAFIKRGDVNVLLCYYNNF